MIKQYEIHPLCKILPELKPDEYEELKSDIKTNGFHKTLPIVLFEDKIIDGRHRYKICNELNVEPVFEKYNGKDAIGYIASTIKGRQMSTGQRAAVASDVANMEAGDNQVTKERGILNLGYLVTLKDASNIFNVSKAAISSYRKLQKEAPDLAEKVRNNENGKFGNKFSLNSGINQLKERVDKVERELKNQDNKLKRQIKTRICGLLKSKMVSSIDQSILNTTIDSLKEKGLEFCLKEVEELHSKMKEYIKPEIKNKAENKKEKQEDEESEYEKFLKSDEGKISQQKSKEKSEQLAKLLYDISENINDKKTAYNYISKIMKEKDDEKLNKSILKVLKHFFHPDKNSGNDEVFKKVMKIQDFII